MTDDTGWLLLARIADVFGVVGFVVVALGLFSSFLSRPRLWIQFHAIDSTAISARLAYKKGTRAARNLNLGFRGLDPNGHELDGDDSIWRAPVFLPRDGIWVLVHDQSLIHPAGQSNEVIQQINKPLGVLLIFDWDNTVVPWLRTRRVLLWTQKERAEGSPPQLLKWRQAAAAVKQAYAHPE